MPPGVRSGGCLYVRINVGIEGERLGLLLRTRCHESIGTDTAYVLHRIRNERRESQAGRLRRRKRLPRRLASFSLTNERPKTIIHLRSSWSEHAMRLEQ